MISRLREPTDALRGTADQRETQLQQFVHQLNMLVLWVAAAVTIKKKISAELMHMISGGILCNYHTHSHIRELNDLDNDLMRNVVKRWCIQYMHVGEQQEL